MEQQITFDKRNYRKHSEKNKAIIRKSLQELGAGRSVLIDKDGALIAGNGVYEQAQKLNIPVRVIETDGTELVAVKRTDIAEGDEKRKRLALADNVASDLGEFDDDLLHEDFSMEELSDWGLEIEEEVSETKEAQEDDFDEDKDNVETVCKEGDLWQLGDHRLLCGDSTKAEDVQRLMQGELADLWLTDPPYNVGYTGGTGLTIQNDKQSDENFDRFLYDAFSAAKDAMKDGCPYYIWTAQGHIQKQFMDAIDKVGMPFRQQIIWNKNALVLGHMDYQWKHEPCLYGWKDGAHYFVNLRNEVTVIPDAEEIDIDKMKKEEMRVLLHQICEAQQTIATTIINEPKPSRSENHPTMKPVRLFVRLIRNSSRKGEIVLDTFGGSGTTIVACEQLNRKARLMELDPHYCDVIIARWEKLTGQKAIRL